MRKTVVKLLWAVISVLCLACMFTLTASADTAKLSDGGYYTISNIDADRYLSVSADAEITFDTEISASSLFEINAAADGTYTVRALATGSEGLYLCCGPDMASEMQYLCSETTALSAKFDIFEQDGEYSLSTADLGTELFLALLASEEGGYSLTVSDGGEFSGWKIEEYKPDSLSLSMYSLTTKPYTSYTDLRAVMSPSNLADYIEWSSSDRSVAIVDDGGKFCALTEGNTVITASFGTYSVSCEVTVSSENSYAWFSQNNVSTGGWNGEPLYNVYFRSGGVKKRFATNNSTKSSDWLSEGCAICSIAQVLNNMGARYTNGYDFRSGIDGNVMADPYTVALANTNNRGAEGPSATLSGDPVFTSHNGIASRFNVDGKQVRVQIKYSVSKKAIKEALDKSPWGVVVCFENSSYGKHYITFNKCLNPDAKNPNDYIFTVSDPASVNGYNADDVIFEESYSYKRLYYRFYQATLMQIWSYDQ